MVHIGVMPPQSHLAERERSAYLVFTRFENAQWIVRPDRRLIADPPEY